MNAAASAGSCPVRSANIAADTGSPSASVRSNVSADR